MGREFELKYAASPEAITALRAEYGPFREISMETTYYDAADHSLSARKWTLRRRLENGAAVCTLKLPLPDGSRGEWETRCDDILDAVPLLCKLGAPEDLPGLISSGLQEVCGARFTRLAALLTLENVTVELALDQGILLGGEKALPLCELEVELKSGDEAAAIAFARLLAARHGLSPEPMSKFKRALLLART